MNSPEVTIQSIGSGGFGVGTLPDGRVVFVPRTAPGDRVRIRVVHEKPRWARGEVLECLQEGPGRREAPCPVYDSCDGCSLQHIDYTEQLRWKAGLVGDAIRRLGKLDIDNPEVAPAPEEFHYRNRITYTLRRLRGGRIVAGFRKLGHRGRVLDLDAQCLLPEEPLQVVWGNLREEWGPGALRLPRGKQLRLTLQSGVDGVGLLIRGGEGTGEPETLLDRIAGLSSVWIQKKGGLPKLLAGDPVMRIGFGDEVLELSPGGFVQINAAMGLVLYHDVLQEIGQAEGRRIIDAYCGPGVLGRALARRGGDVTGIDLAPSWTPASDRSGTMGFKRVVGRVEKELKRLLPADVVLLNPPRTGLEASIPETLAAEAVEDVVYVSCDPATLARDLMRMGGGYRVTRVRSFDLFPQTGHVETVVTLKGSVKENQ